MTTIATTEELQALPDGNTIRILDTRNGTKVWTKAGEEFVLNGMTITEDMLTAALAANVVETGPIFSVGQRFRNESYEYFVLRVNDNDSADIMKVYEREYVESVSNFTEVLGVPVVTEPADTRERALLTAGNLILQEQRRTEAQRINVQQVRDQEKAARKSVNDAILAAIANFDDDDDVQRMVTVLRDWGWEVPTRTVSYSIGVSCSTEHEDADITDEAARSIVGDGGDSLVTIDSTEAVIRWTYVIEHTDEYEGDNSDACEDRNLIDTYWAEERLREQGFTVTNVDEITSRSCSECNS